MMFFNLFIVILGMNVWFNVKEVVDVIFYFKREKKKLNNCCYRYKG